MSNFTDYLYSEYKAWRLKKLTEDSDAFVTQYQFAQELGLNPATYNSYSRGRSRPTLEACIKMSRMLGSRVFQEADLTMDLPSYVIAQIAPHLTPSEMQEVVDLATRLAAAHGVTLEGTV